MEPESTIIHPDPVNITCNGAAEALLVSPDTLLIDVLREELELTGTKLGCGTGDCGACTVLLDGEPVNACLVYAVECADHAIETIEGVARSDEGKIIIEQLVESGGVQCGICSPGFVVMAKALIAHGAVQDRATIEAGLAGNLCRCTGYLPIIAAV